MDRRFFIASALATLSAPAFAQSTADENLLWDPERQAAYIREISPLADVESIRRTTNNAFVFDTRSLTDIELNRAWKFAADAVMTLSREQPDDYIFFSCFMYTPRPYHALPINHDVMWRGTFEPLLRQRVRQLKETFSQSGPCKSVPI